MSYFAVDVKYFIPAFLTIYALNMSPVSGGVNIGRIAVNRAGQVL